MTNKPPAYTDRQLKTFDVLERNKMAWTMFTYLLCAFGVISLSLIIAVFFVSGIETWIKAVFAALDTVIGWSIRYVVVYLFPSSQVKPAQISEGTGS